jgi:Na+-driven multidrug efflux pump
VLCYVLIRAGSLVVSANVTGPVDYHRVAQIVNQTVYYVIWVAAVISIAYLAKDLSRLASGGHHRVPVGQAGQKP